MRKNVQGARWYKMNGKPQALYPWILWVALWSRSIGKEWLLNLGLPSASVSWAAYFWMVWTHCYLGGVTDSVLTGHVCSHSFGWGWDTRREKFQPCLGSFIQWILIGHDEMSGTMQVTLSDTTLENKLMRRIELKYRKARNYQTQPFIF